MEPSLPPAPAATPEVFAEILDRHRRRRQWLLGTGIVVALVAGFVGGWSLDRSTDDGGVTRTATGPGVETDDEGAGRARPVPNVAREEGAEGSFRRLSLRTTDAGIAIRLYLAPSAPMACSADQPCPPADCAPATLQAEVSNREAVGTAGTHVAAALEPGELRALTAMPFGVIEGGPATVVLVAGGEGIHSVRLSADGAADEAPIEEGFAALALPGVLPTPSVVGLDAGGDEVAQAAVSVEGAPFYDSGRCEPVPPALPEEHDPPSDRAAAERAVRDVAVEVFRRKSPGEERDVLAWVEDGDELRSVQDEVEARYGTEATEIAIDVGEMTFQGPDHATFRYDFFYNGGTLLTGHLGRAVRQDGEWKIARSFWCSMIQRGGITCPSD